VTIAVDARELAGRPTGVGRYLSELLARWDTSADAARHQWRLYVAQPVSVRGRFEQHVTVLPGTGGTSWEQWTFPRALSRDKPDVLFAPGYSAPITAPCPVVVTIHDVSFAAHPEWFAPREGMRRRTMTRWSARRARTVLTDSNYSRDEIVRHVGVSAEKIRVVPLGVNEASGRGSPVDPSGREPLVLFVGSLFRRRHVDVLIEAFVEVVARRVPASRLEIVGDNRLYPPGDPSTALRSCPAEIARRVSVRSYVDDQTLRDLYNRASVFAFLSEYEGFGLTPLEALAAGVPPLVLDTAIAREVYGGAAEYVPDLGVHTVGESLTALLTQPGARLRVLEHAGAVLARYSWDRAADDTLRILEEAALG
jgi:glycosyltransferase involved in cell wall biosynthesis